MKAVYIGIATITTDPLNLITNRPEKKLLIAIHIVNIVKEGKKASLPPKTFLDEKGYTDVKSDFRASSYEDYAKSFSVDEKGLDEAKEYIRNLNINNSHVYLNREVRSKLLPTPTPMIGLKYVMDIILNDISGMNLNISNEVMNKHISFDLEVVLGILGLEYGHEYSGKSEPTNYWKRLKKRKHTSFNNCHRVSGDYRTNMYMFYADSHMTSVENFEAYHLTYTEEPDDFYKEVCKLTDSIYDDEVLTIMVNKNIYSIIFARLFNKFGYKFLYTEFNRHKNTKMYMGRFYSNVSKEVELLHISERRVRPVLEITRTRQMLMVANCGDCILGGEKLDIIGKMEYVEIPWDGNINTRKTYLLNGKKVPFLPKIFGTAMKYNKKHRYFTGLYEYDGDTFIAFYAYDGKTMISANSADLPLYLDKSDKEIDGLIIKKHSDAVLKLTNKIEKEFLSL